MLGFTATDTGSATSQTSPNVVDVFSPVNAYIQVREFGSCGLNTKNVYYTFKTTLNGNSGELIDHTSSEYFEQLLPFIGNVQELNIRLVYSDGTDMVLNGANWSFTINLEQGYLNK